MTDFFGLSARGVQRGGLRRGKRGLAMSLNPLLKKRSKIKNKNIFYYKKTFFICF